MARKPAQHPTHLASRRQFMAAPAVAALASAYAAAEETPAKGQDVQVRPGGHPSGFDPWIEIIADAFRHNVKEVAKLTGGTPILAVVKNNGYGLGDQAVGPILAACPEVEGVACTRTSEALAMRKAGVRKPILNMAETSEEEIVELAKEGIWPSVWLDDAQAKLRKAAKQLGKPVRIHACIDTGMNREGMPEYRAKDWFAGLCTDKSIVVDGTYMMFSHELEADQGQFARFKAFTDAARKAGHAIGKLHGSPTYEVLYYPKAKFDLVRPGNLLFGNYRSSSPPPLKLDRPPELKPVFRLCAKVSRLERLRAGDSAGYDRARYTVKKPTWVALLPVGATDGYPTTAANTCSVLIRGRLYPVVSAVSSAYTIVEIGDEKAVEVGDVATLIGPDHPTIAPHAVAEKTGTAFLPLIQRMGPFLPQADRLSGGVRARSAA